MQRRYLPDVWFHLYITLHSFELESKYTVQQILQYLYGQFVLLQTSEQRAPKPEHDPQDDGLKRLRGSNFKCVLWNRFVRPPDPQHWARCRKYLHSLSSWFLVNLSHLIPFEGNRDLGNCQNHSKYTNGFKHTLSFLIPFEGNHDLGNFKITQNIQMASNTQ